MLTGHRNTAGVLWKGKDEVTLGTVYLSSLTVHMERQKRKRKALTTGAVTAAAGALPWARK